MNLVKEIVYPNNGKRPTNPTNAIGDQQIKELNDYKLAGMLPAGISAIANGKPLYGAAWNNLNAAFWSNRVGMAKTWTAQKAIRVVVPDRNLDGSFKMLPFAPGRGFNFSKWNRAVADFYNSWYGNFFTYLPDLVEITLSEDQAIDTNYKPGPTMDYPLGTSDAPMGPLKALRFDDDGNLKIFEISEFRNANPVIGEGSYIIPAPIVGVDRSILLSEIGNIARNSGMSVDVRWNTILGLMGVPIPAGSTQVPSV